MEKPYQEEPRLNNEYWEDVIAYSKLKPKIKFLRDDKYKRFDDVYLLSRHVDKGYDKFYDGLECDESCLEEGSCEYYDGMTFDKFIEKNHEIRIVKFYTENWIQCTCTCYTYLKEFLSKHILVICLTKKILKIPEKFYDSIIDCKPKPGIKKKAEEHAIKKLIFIIFIRSTHRVLIRVKSICELKHKFSSNVIPNNFAKLFENEERNKIVCKEKGTNGLIAAPWGSPDWTFPISKFQNFKIMLILNETKKKIATHLNKLQNRPMQLN
ncbi:hypothetical protein BpHYR1_016637 [Brachionus plicatilis]|uniref:Uncharacterized protein n=1 Tax=Brachionus plicatilis TaxID=10195 RepID=A0A3M7Q4G9_BRAPC|nr:hypothetical protein BpHYR1_016637 [Brachionus plicatilis]